MRGLICGVLWICVFSLDHGILGSGTRVSRSAFREVTDHQVGLHLGHVLVVEVGGNRGLKEVRPVAVGKVLNAPIFK